MADFTVEGIVDVDASRGVREVRRFKSELKTLMAQLKAVDKELDKLDGRKINVEVRADTKNLSKLRADLKSIGDEKVKVNIDTDADTGALADDIERIKAAMSGIGGADISVGADTTEAVKDVGRLVSMIEKVRAVIKVDADTGPALRDALRLKEEINGMNSQIRVTADTEGIRTFSKDMNAAKSSVGGGGMGGGGLIAAILALISLTGPLGAALLGAGAGVVGGLSVLGVGFAAFGALAAPTVSKLTENIKLLNQAATETDPTKLAELNKKIAQLKKTSPLMYEAATGAMELKNRFMELSKEIKPQVLGTFNNLLSSANTLLGYMAPIAVEVADAVELMSGRMAEALKGDDWKNFFSYVEENAGSFVEGTLATLGNFITGFANLVVQLDPLTKMVGAGFRGMSEDFLKWSQGLENNQSFQDFVDYMTRMGPKVWNALKVVGEVILDIIIALAPMGEAIIDGVNAFGRWYDKLKQTNPEAADMAIQLGAIVIAAVALSGPIMAIVGPFASLLGLLGPIVSGLGPLGGLLMGAGGGGAAAGIGIGGLVLALGALAFGLTLTKQDTEEFKEMMDQLGDTWDALKENASELWDNIKKLWDIFQDSGAIERLQGAFTNIFSIIERLLPLVKIIATINFAIIIGALIAFAYALDAATWALDKLIGGISWLIGKIVDGLGNALDFLTSEKFPQFLQAVGAVISALPGIVANKFTQMGASVAAKVSQMQVSTVNKFNTMKAGVQGASNALWNSVVTRAVTGVASVVAKYENLRSQAINKFNAMKNSIITTSGTMVAGVIAKGEAMKNGWITKLATMAAQTLNKAREIKNNITGFFSGAGEWLRDAGAKLIAGLVSGIASRIIDVKNKMGELASTIKGFLPGSPVKTGPLRSWNNGGAGKRLIGGLADGMGAKRKVVNKEIKSIAENINGLQDAAQKMDFGKKQIITRAEALKQGNLPGLPGLNDRYKKSQVKGAFYGLEQAEEFDPDFSSAFDGMGAGGKGKGKGNGNGGGDNYYTINVKVPVGANLAQAGKQIVAAIEAYEKQGGRKKRTVAEKVGK